MLTKLLCHYSLRGFEHLCVYNIQIDPGIQFPDVNLRLTDETYLLGETSIDRTEHGSRCKLQFIDLDTLYIFYYFEIISLLTNG